MANCVIHPIPLFQFSVEKSLITYRLNFGQQINQVAYVWYIEGARENIVVDASGAVDLLEKGIGAPVERIQTLQEGIGKLGMGLDDIDLVILTQLHYDHMAGASEFPKARFLIQRSELEFAQNPHPLFASWYRKGLLDRLNFEVISGDSKLSEEISVISTPGHTPGGQSVCIKTAQGVAIIAGLCTIQENFEPPSPVALPVIAPGTHTNAFDAYDSLLRIKELADIVVSPHDAKFQYVTSIP